MRLPYGEPDWLPEAVERYRALLASTDPGHAAYRRRLTAEIARALDEMTPRQQRRYYDTAIEIRRYWNPLARRTAA